MFPTFISILDIQSWWEVPSVAHFCSLFRTAFNLLDFDIEDLEEALLTDGTEEASWLQELIVRLLSGCLPNNEISTFNYQMFLRRLFRQKCQDQYNPFNTDIDFQLLPLRTKVDILHALCDFRLDADDVLDQLKNLESDSLRVEPLGYDDNQSAYWYFYGTRLYREDFKNKHSKKEKSVWQVICFTEEDWFQLAKKFKKAVSKTEKQLHRTLIENFLPELPRLFREKERLARKRLLDNQPRRTSNRIRKQESTAEEEEKLTLTRQLEIEKEKQRLEEEEEEKRKSKRREAYERRAKLREQSEERHTEHSDDWYEMAGAKIRDKKTKNRPRQYSESSSSSKDRSSVFSSTSNHASSRNNVCSDSKMSTSATGTTTVGRQTNNSLACATGQIVIQPVSNLHRKKLKTSQVFRQTDEDLQTGMHKILDYVKNHDDAWPFVDPVEEDIAPNYYSVIRKPMDLQRMEERLDSGHYKTFSRFRSDFQLIVGNCRLYNGADNEYTQMVDNLLKVFERATERYLDEITSTDEEIAVEYPDLNKDSKINNKRKKSDSSYCSKRKPTLAAQTDRRRDRSNSEDTASRKSDSSDVLNKIFIDNKKQTNRESQKTEHIKDNKKQTKNSKAKLEKQNKVETLKKNHKNSKAGRKCVKKSLTPSPVRSRSRSFSRSPSKDRWSSSPPPSWPPSSPDDGFDFSPKKNDKRENSYHLSDEEKTTKSKAKHDKWKEVYKEDIENYRERKVKDLNRPISPPKQRDKHNKLRETIEKLKAKSEICNKLKERDCSYDKNKLSKESPTEKLDNKSRKQDNKTKSKPKQKIPASIKSDIDFEDGNSTVDSIQSENKKQDKNSTNNKTASAKNAAIEALTLATEQTLKDINKWLDDTPKFSEFSSASNSPSHFSNLDDFDNIGNKIEQDFRKKLDKPLQRKDCLKDIKRRPFRDPTKLFRRREVQRTIDRLQPGKSKGNLISNIQNTNKPDELFPLGPLSKIKDTKNSLIVKTDQDAPKLSLGSVLDSFGKHKFVDDPKKDEDEKDVIKEEPLVFSVSTDNAKHSNTNVKTKSSETKLPNEAAKTTASPGKATPNLSAWFKAFGAPKVQPPQKKSDSKADSEKDDTGNKVHDSKKEELKKVVAVPDSSPTPDSPVMQHGQPIPRQRKISTGSSMSERSSFSQDLDSPRVGIDERLGAYPAPYPSPLHKSPSGASPIMASPRPDVSPKAASYPTFNGQIRVGFYQDTVSTKSSPDKSCSPRDNPQSPYAQYSEHVYTPPTTQNSTYSYNNPPYYSQTPSYSTSNPTPPYNLDQNNSSCYYDTNKPLTDQYQAKITPTYVNSPISNTQLPSPVTHQSPPVTQQSSPTVDIFHQEQMNTVPQKQQTAMFPVKKRAYNDDTLHITSNRYDGQHKSDSQEEPYSNRTADTILVTERQVNVDTDSNSPIQRTGPDNKETPKQYVHQNIPEPKSAPMQNVNNQQSNITREEVTQEPNQESGSSVRNVSYSTPNTYNYNPEASYPLNIPTTRTIQSDRTIDMTKYTNMDYSGTEIGLTRPTQFSRSDINYSRTTPITTSVQNFIQTTAQSLQANNLAMRYSDPSIMNMGYKGIPVNTSTNNLQNSSQLSNLSNSNALQNARVTSESVVNCTNPNLDVPSSYKTSEVSVPRPSYSTPSSLDMDQSLSIRGNLPTLTHIVDRYQSDERMLGLQTSPPSYYADKNISSAHMFSKPIATSSSGLPIFSQSNMAIPYSHNMQATSPMYSRPITESNVINQDKNNTIQQQMQEKKSKRRKSSKSGTPPTNFVDPAPNSNAPSQGFQSYAGLKNTSAMEPSAISLKTASVVPGSAFNFGPTPTGLGLSSGLYGDKDAYPNFLEDFRAAPNYYMAAAAAAAHHRSTPEAAEKPLRTSHQSGTAQPSGYHFIGAPQSRPPSYPLGGAFMSPHQGPLVDASSPIYQQYLQAGVLHQGLLGPPGAYPTGYHPALSMRQPYDPMTRTSWL